MNIVKLILALENKIATETSEYKRLAIIKAIKYLKTNPVGYVQTFGSLPPVATNVGELFFVLNDNLIYYSTGTSWLPINDAIENDMWAWGQNLCGRLGDNTVTNKSSPVSVVGSITNWCQVSAGRFHGLAVRSNGSMWAWGYGTFGRLGDNTTINKSSPVVVTGGITDWCQASAGENHSLAVRCNGTLWAWGNGECGQLGINCARTIPLSVSSPVSVVGGFTDWCQISAGTYHSTALRCGGGLWAWGCNPIGQLGNNSTVDRSSPVSIINPPAITGGYTVSSIGSSLLGAASLTSSLTPTTGNNDDGFWQLTLPWSITFDGVSYSDIYVGTNAYITFSAGSSAFSALSGSNPALPKIMISAADRSAQRIYFGTEGVSPNRTYRVRWEGHTSASGGVVGSPTMVIEYVFYENAPSQIDVQIGTNGAAGTGVTGVFRADGTSLASGFVSTANVGQRLTVLAGISASTWQQVSAGDTHTLGLALNGTLWSWGCNAVGRLGDNTATNRSTPGNVTVCTDWCQISAGLYHSLAVRTNCSLWAWGCNGVGRLGDGTVTNRSSPVSVVGGFTDWCQASAGGSHSIALRTNGTLWAWGDNTSGKLGDNTTVAKSSPVSVVGGFTDWCQISAGRNHNLGVKTNGLTWGWGCNNAGQLGDNTVTGRSSPVSVVGGFTDWCQASAGILHSIAVKCDGTLWAWGCNQTGRLGDNTTTNRSSPVSVIGGITSWCRTSASTHSLALTTGCIVYAFGLNSAGQLGSGNDITFFFSSPVSVVGGFIDWCQVSAGCIISAAVRRNGSLWAWGVNASGQLGDGTVISRSSPVSVVGGFTDWCQVSAGFNEMAAVRQNGTLWTWGANVSGQLADNTSVLAKSSPVSVVGGFTDWRQVSMTGQGLLALRGNGTLWGAGINTCGRIGDGTTTCRSSPVSVVGGFTDWCAITTSGSILSAGIRTNGTLWAWGQNYCGSLGDNTTTARSSPVSVVGGFTSWSTVSAGGAGAFLTAIKGI